MSSTFTPQAIERFRAILTRWDGTPYIDGHCTPQIGVDCARFADAVLMALYGLDLPPLPRLPPATSLANARGVATMTRLIRRRFPNRIIKHADLSNIEPGDLLLERQPGHQHPSHILITGPDRRLWHATPGTGVGTASRSMLGHITRIYRPLEKHRWHKP